MTVRELMNAMRREMNDGHAELTVRIFTRDQSFDDPGEGTIGSISAEIDNERKFVAVQATW